MIKTESRNSQISETIPSPQIVRERLGQTLREANLLRQLLRVSVKAHSLNESMSKSKEVALA